MQKSHIINKAIDQHLAEVKRNGALKWSSVNLCLISVLIFDIYQTDQNDAFYKFEILAAFIILISLLKNVITCLYYTFFTEELTCESEEQRILLNLNKSNSSIKSPPKNEVRKQDTDLFSSNVRNLSWQSYGERK